MRGTPRRRHVLAAGAVALLLVLGVASVAVVAGLSPAPRTHPALAAGNEMVIHSAHGSSYIPALQGKRPLFVLALGSDARPGQAINGQRADSIHLIGVDLVHHRATVLGFPRDSWVNIPGHGTNKINSAMSLGGPSLMVQTVEALTGIRIDFWLLTSFNGLVGMVNSIGGLSVDVPTAMHDHFSGANFSAGVHHLSGKQALAFARDRHDVPGGDLGRSGNQGRLLVAALAKLHTKFSADPATLLTWIGIGWHNVHTDLTLGTLLDLALTATSIPASAVNNLVVPASVGTVGSASVVFISGSASSIYADMRADGVAR